MSFLDDHALLVSTLFAALSGVVMGLVYLRIRMGHRFRYAVDAKMFWVFLGVNALVAAGAWFLWGPPLAEAASRIQMVNHFLMAASSGVVLVSTSVFGVAKSPFRQDKGYVNLISRLVAPIEESIGDVVYRREHDLEAKATHLGLTTNQLARGLEKAVARRYPEDDERRKQAALEIEAARSKDNRLALIGLVLNFYSPRSAESAFFEFCSRQPA